MMHQQSHCFIVLHTFTSVMDTVETEALPFWTLRDAETERDTIKARDNYDEEHNTLEIQTAEIR